MSGYVGSSAMSSFKNSMPTDIIDISSRSDADTAYHGSQLIGNIVTIQIQCGNHRIFFRHQQRVLQKGIGNAILDNQPPLRQRITKFPLCQFISPLFETSFGEFHYIPLVYQRDGRQMMIERILTGSTHQTLRSFLRHRLHPKRGGFGKADFRHSHLIPQKTIKFLCFRSTCLPLDTGIYILGILTENGHIDCFRGLQRRMHSHKPAHRTQAYI